MDSSAAPPELRDSANQIEDEHLLLTTNQAELLDKFRKNVHLCKTDAEKFQLCAEMRSELLDQYTQVELLIALFERIMLDECPNYRNYKKNKGRVKMTEPDDAEWEHFIDIAMSGSATIEKFLPQLKVVSI